MLQNFPKICKSGLGYDDDDGDDDHDDDDHDDHDHDDDDDHDEKVTCSMT